MYARMPLQITLLPEEFITHITPIQTFSTMNALVHLQITLFSE
jgi:hypothetical protein